MKSNMPVAYCSHQFKNWWQPYDAVSAGRQHRQSSPVADVCWIEVILMDGLFFGAAGPCPTGHRLLLFTTRYGHFCRKLLIYIFYDLV